jgi:hypothetical protein
MHQVAGVGAGSPVLSIDGHDALHYPVGCRARRVLSSEMMYQLLCTAELPVHDSHTTSHPPRHRILPWVSPRDGHPCSVLSPCPQQVGQAGTTSRCSSLKDQPCCKHG